jgi:SOS-response transcriptional repressor LexA
MRLIMKKISIKQLQVLEAIEYFINQEGISPTYREIADLLKCDVRQVFEKVLILEEKGYVSTINGKARTIRILKKV